MRGLLLAAGLSLGCAAVGWSQEVDPIAQQYGRAIEAAERGRLTDAVAVMESVTVRVPDAANAFWNLGLWRARLDQPAEALAAWVTYRRLVPSDWHARAKVIQAYQALGDTLRRNAERADLLALYRAGTDTVLARMAEYCIDQFRVDSQQVMGYETIAPTGERRTFYTFYLLDERGELASRYSLGSYDNTTAVARETGSIGADERIYHLDWYGNRAHSTHGFFRTLPSYDEVKALVLAAIRGEREPVSGATVR